MSSAKSFNLVTKGKLNENEGTATYLWNLLNISERYAVVRVINQH